MVFDLKKKLEKYSPSSSEEQEFKQQMLSFINEPGCYERSLEEGHFTGSAWLESKDGSKALLMHHTKLDSWFQLGGHADGDPDLLAVAIKEAQEESGIEGIEPVSEEIFDIDIHLIPEKHRIKAHYHYDVRFHLRVTSDEEVQQNIESKELRWIPKDAPNLPTESPSVVRMFNKWRAARY